MSTLHRTVVYARYSTPLLPFQPFAIHEGGELRQNPGHGRVQYVHPGIGNIPIPYEGGPRWSGSHDEGVRAAIDELEAAAASIASLLDQLRQELLKNNRHAVASSGSMLHPPVEPAPCGTTPAVAARSSVG